MTASSSASPNTRKGIKLGDGLEKGVTMGPLANPRRLDAMEAIVNDSKNRGGKIVTGGKRHGNQGFFFEPTVITDLPDDSKLMTEEPFGPIAPIVAFKTFDEVVERANSLPYGLAAYAFTSSAQTANMIGDALQSGMVGREFGRDLDAGNAVRRRQGIRLRPRRRHRGARGLHQPQVHLAGLSAYAFRDLAAGRPDLLDRRRHIHVGGGLAGNRVGDRIHDRGQCGGGAGLADALHAERIGGRRNRMRIVAQIRLACGARAASRSP